MSTCEMGSKSYGKVKRYKCKREKERQEHGLGCMSYIINPIEQYAPLICYLQIWK